MPEHHPLDLFDPAAVEVAPLPAAEVRRLGDRRRSRRRTTVTALGAATAVAVIVLGAAVASLPDRGRTPAPADPPPPTPSMTAPTATSIPEDFPIDATGSTPEAPPDTYLAQQLEFCGAAPLADLTPVDARSAQMAGGEMTTAVTLLLFDGVPAADRALADLLDGAAGCPREVTNVVGEVEVLPAGSGWPGRTIRTSYPEDARYVHAVQAGPAVLLSSWYVAATPPGLGLTQSRAAIAEPLAAMDELWDVPAWSPDGTGSPVPGASGTDIPDDFPLGLAHRDLTGDGGELLGPGPDVPGLEEERVCAAGLWQGPGTDRLAFASTGPAGYADVRELRTFATADDAAVQMQGLRAGLAGCDRESRGGTIVWTTYAEDTGYASITVGSTHEGSLGGVIYQVTRVGRAVLAISRSGEWSLETAPSGAAEVTEVTRQVAPELCPWTEAGC